MKTHRPFWYWLFREPSDFAALVAGILFLMISMSAADHCVSLFSFVWGQLDGSGWGYYMAFPASNSGFWLCIVAYGGFAAMLIWRRLSQRSTQFTLIFSAALLVLVTVWVVDQSALWYLRNESHPGAIATYEVSVARAEEWSQYSESTKNWDDDIKILAMSLTFILLVQYLFARLGWAIAHPRFRFRASVFVRTWAYSNLAFGPLIFPIHLVIGCLWLVFGGAAPAQSSLVSGLIWILAWTLYSTIVPVTLAIRMVRRRAQRLRPRCLKCGYSLTGNVSGRCPECGESIPKEIQEKLTAETRP